MSTLLAFSLLWWTWTWTCCHIVTVDSYDVLTNLVSSNSSKEDTGYRNSLMKCHNSTLPVPDSISSSLPEFRIDLDSPAEERWKTLTSEMKPQITRFLQVVRNDTSKLFGTEVWRVIDNYLPLLTKTLPKQYYEEIVGISEAIERPIGEITLYNVFYEFFSMCTSIVMQDENGGMYHGRNLDFGFLMGWDIRNKTWLVAELLRPLTVKVTFERSGKAVYESVNFAGYIGVLTAVKKNAFSLSINERFKWNGGMIGLVEWILGRRDQQWNGIVTRRVMESAKTYKEAQKLLSSFELVAPSYFIVTGTKPNEGSVITRGRNDVDFWYLKGANQNDSWYLVQTNYDHWKKPPSFDDRITPTITCMENFGRTNPTSTLYNVLSTVPVLNKLTVYTVIMEPKSGNMKIWLQNCVDPCWPW